MINADVPVTTAAPSMLIGITDHSEHSNDTQYQYLLNVEIQVQPGKEHLEVLFKETKVLLSYIQQVDPKARFISKAGQTSSLFPPLTSPTDKHWPTTYLAAQNWYHTTMGYLFQQDPITEQQLQSRLASKKGRHQGQTEKESKCTSSAPEEKVPTSIYATINLYTTYYNIPTLVDSINIDLRRHKIRASLKDLQCWESSPQKMLCGVNSSLCATGVCQLLLHKLKQLEKRLCRHGKLNTLEWYDKPCRSSLSHCVVLDLSKSHSTKKKEPDFHSIHFHGKVG